MLKMKIVKIETLLNFIKSKVPNLTDPEIINSATGYHYTMHSGCIEQMSKFLGRSIDGDMDRSQHSLESVKATDENGVKFSRGFSGLLAQIVQHENDHLDGILFIDKAIDMEEIKPENIK